MCVSFLLDKVICLLVVIAEAQNSNSRSMKKYSTGAQRLTRFFFSVVALRVPELSPPLGKDNGLSVVFLLITTSVFCSQLWRTAGFSCWIFPAVNSKCRWQMSQFRMKEDTFASSTLTPHRKVIPQSQCWVRNVWGCVLGNGVGWPLLPDGFQQQGRG